MLEWLKRHAWKACVPQKGIASSNLALSAEIPCSFSAGDFSLGVILEPGPIISENQPEDEYLQHGSKADN